MRARPSDCRSLADRRFRPIEAACYESTAAETAPLLLGHFFLRKIPGGWAGGIIVETEAYLDGDPACHAFRGKTPRTAAMFGPPGFSYVYFTYGCHHCANFVCRPEGVAEAVLLRALEPTVGIEWMQSNRPIADIGKLANGPGKLTAALALDRSHNGLPLFQPRGPLLVAANPDRDRTLAQWGPIAVTPRIGVNQAVDWPLRFVLSKSAYLSRKLTAPAPAASTLGRKRSSSNST